MKCPKCQAENLADSVFCEECSAPLEAACPACGTRNRSIAKFCRKCRASLTAIATVAPDPRAYTPKHLADKILQSKSALEGERKQVTVLFADVKGSMELAEQLDPEEWHAILDRFFAILTDGVHRFEGYGRPVHRRRHHGAVRRADRARGPRAARLLRGAASARRRARVRQRGARAARGRLSGAHRPQLGRRRRRPDRRRSAHGLHGAGTHRRPGAAHGGARRIGAHLLVASTRRGWSPATSSCRTWVAPRSRAWASRWGSSISKGWARFAPASTARALAASADRDHRRGHRQH